MADVYREDAFDLLEDAIAAMEEDLEPEFAAGDVTQVRDKQIVVAAGEGAKAALSAHEYLMGQR